MESIKYYRAVDPEGLSEDQIEEIEELIDILCNLIPDDITEEDPFIGIDMNTIH